MNLTHNNFGIGQVVSEDHGNITINFQGVVKTLIVKFANLKNEDGSDYGVSFIAKKEKSKKLNRSNFMTKEDVANYVPMTRNEYDADRRRAQLTCKSW